MYYRSQAIAILTIAGLVLGGISPATHAQNGRGENLPVQVTPIATTDLLTVTLTGGACLPRLCDRTLVIQRNGNYQYFIGEGIKATGQLRRRELLELKRLIKQANFESIKSQPFKGTCPIAYDGSKTIYRFFPKGQPAEVIDDCEIAVDVQQPLFKQTQAILQRLVMDAAEGTN